MNNKEKPNSEGVQDKVKLALEQCGVEIYPWMFDTGLHQADLLVYACMFDILKRYPLTPQRVNMSDIGRRIHYSPSSVHFSVDMLVDHGFLFRKGERKGQVYSLYPIE